MTDSVVGAKFCRPIETKLSCFVKDSGHSAGNRTAVDGSVSIGSHVSMIFVARFVLPSLNSFAVTRHRFICFVFFDLPNVVLHTYLIGDSFLSGLYCKCVRMIVWLVISRTLAALIVGRAV